MGGTTGIAKATRKKKGDKNLKSRIPMRIRGITGGEGQKKAVWSRILPEERSETIKNIIPGKR